MNYTQLAAEAQERAQTYRALGATDAADIAEDTARKVQANEALRAELLARRASSKEDEITQTLVGR